MKALNILLLSTLIATRVFAQSPNLGKQAKATVVSNITKSLEADYVYLDTAKKMGSYLQQQLDKGAYDTIKTPTVFADRLTADLLSVYHDGHLSISYNPGFTNGSGKVDTVAARKRREFIKRLNFGFDKIEMLPGGISYIKIGGFAPLDTDAKVMALAAFRLAGNGKALIVDLRENHGGDPGMVSYLCSFLFASKTHLNDLYTRSDKSLQQFWTVPNHELPALQSIPVYILTSKMTFSAGEEFTYDLQTQKRATVIGETTGGGAHPVRPFVVGNGFVANIPFARAINPITKTNWEKTGIKPDVAAPVDQALDVALKMIAEGK